MSIGSWSPPRKYKGLRTQFVQAIKVTIPYPDRDHGRSLNTFANRNLVNEKLAEMEDWCEENCTRSWSSSGYCSWYFDRMGEAVMFKMIFGGR